MRSCMYSENILAKWVGDVSDHPILYKNVVCRFPLSRDVKACVVRLHKYSICRKKDSTVFVAKLDFERHVSSPKLMWHLTCDPNWLSNRHGFLKHCAWIPSLSSFHEKHYKKQYIEPPEQLPSHLIKILLTGYSFHKLLQDKQAGFSGDHCAS